MGLTLTTEGRVLHCGSWPDENVIKLGEYGNEYKLPPEKALILAAKLLHSVAALREGGFAVDMHSDRFQYAMGNTFDEAIDRLHALYNGDSA